MIIRSITFFLFLAIGTKCFGASAGSCSNLFLLIPEGHFDDSENDVIKYRLGRREVARVEYSYNATSKTLFIGWVEVHEFKGHGLPAALFEELLIRYPETTRLSGYLTDVNYLKFMEKYSDRNDLNESLKNTPFYKSVSPLGFKIILDNHLYGERVIFLIERVLP
jgi:hypothetical protein